MELEANIFRILISLWCLPLVKNFRKSMRHTLDDLTWNYPMKNFFLLVIVAMITVNMFLPILKAAVVMETYFFIRMMQTISSNYNWENGVKQITITEENYWSCILCQLLRTKTLASGLKWIKHFFYIFTTIFLYLLRGCEILKSPW